MAERAGGVVLETLRIPAGRARGVRAAKRGPAAGEFLRNLGGRDLVARRRKNKTKQTTKPGLRKRRS